MAVAVGNSQTKYSMGVKGDAKDVHISIGDSAIASSKTQTRELMDTVGKTAGKVIESGGEILRAPAVWLKNIQDNWLAYIILAAIVLSCIVFLYCALCRYLHNNKQNNLASGNLNELIKTIANKDAASRQHLPPSIADIPRRRSNSFSIINA